MQHDIAAPRLRLQPFAPAALLALIEGTPPFENIFGVPLADGLRDYFTSGDVSDAWLQRLRGSRTFDVWFHGFAIVHPETGRMIGTCAFKGAPDADGVVEIAYGIAPSYQNQGFATEAASALVTFAFACDDVRCVRAHTLPERNASTRVLTKCGFTHLGEVMDPEDGRVWRWERT